MNSNEFKAWLAKHGCTFDAKRSGSGHLIAIDALLTVIAARIDDHEDVPLPSALTENLHPVTLSTLAEAKILLYRAMRDGGISKGELARRLGDELLQIDHLLDLEYASPLDQIEAAARAFGKRLEIAIV